MCCDWHLWIDNQNGFSSFTFMIKERILSVSNLVLTFLVLAEWILTKLQSQCVLTAKINTVLCLTCGDSKCSFRQNWIACSKSFDVAVYSSRSNPRSEAILLCQFICKMKRKNCRLILSNIIRLKCISTSGKCWHSVVRLVWSIGTWS